MFIGYLFLFWNVSISSLHNTEVNYSQCFLIIIIFFYVIGFFCQSFFIYYEHNKMSLYIAEDRSYVCSAADMSWIRVHVARHYFWFDNKWLAT